MDSAIDNVGLQVNSTIVSDYIITHPTNEINNMEKEFYVNAQKYWSQIPPTVNGMLGGLGHISNTDVDGSKQFLRELNLPGHTYALDCGAGIGRVSKYFLMPLFDKVDLVEQDEHFAQTAKDYCKGEHLGKIYNMGLQKFTPEEGKYDLIWSQWVLGHLTDEDLLCFYQRIQLGLRKGGYFVMKENMSNSGKVELDEKDSSVTRPLSTVKKILRKAGFYIVKVSEQEGFPKGLFPVYTIACQPVGDVKYPFLQYLTFQYWGTNVCLSILFLLFVLVLCVYSQLSTNFFQPAPK